MIVTKKEKYEPNVVPLKKRIINSLLIVFLLGYGAYGIIKEELYVPLGKGHEVTLYGNAIYVGTFSFFLGCCYLLTQIVDHFDKRDNEEEYRRFEVVFKGFAILFFVFALIVNLAYTLET